MDFVYSLLQGAGDHRHLGRVPRVAQRVHRLGVLGARQQRHDRALGWIHGGARHAEQRSLARQRATCKMYGMDGMAEITES